MVDKGGPGTIGQRTSEQGRRGARETPKLASADQNQDAEKRAAAAPTAAVLVRDRSRSKTTRQKVADARDRRHEAQIFSSGSSAQPGAVCRTRVRQDRKKLPRVRLGQTERRIVGPDLDAHIDQVLTLDQQQAVRVLGAGFAALREMGVVGAHVQLREARERGADRDQAR